ncbi:MAG: DUF4832 domain-containing protein [Tidjanibacter sp.]|nr:DUF4832 domain-containing protein [Tidjanibacter sp.]
MKNSWMKILLMLLAMGVVATACNGAIEEEDYQDYERVELQSKITSVQPMTGIVVWNTSGSNRQEYIQLEYSYMLYNEVCKQKDVFDWSPMEKLLEGVASRGHQAVVRFRYTYPGKSSAVPDYIKALPDYEQITAKSEGRDTEFPDWRHPELQRFHKEFHRQFAERYDKDPRLAFVQTGFGLWAEYHIYDGRFIMGQTFPSHDFQREFMLGMDEWFEDCSWSISIDAGDGTYGPFDKYPELLNLHFGNFDDSFMHKQHGDYNTEMWMSFGEDRYQHSPRGGEFSYYSDYDQQHCLDKEGMYGRTFESEVAKFHMTYIIGDGQPRYQTPARLKEAAMSMGYKFTILDYKVKGSNVAVLIGNTGVAPIYRDAYVAVGGVCGNVNLRNLMPGEQTWVHIEGGYSEGVVPTIECAHLVKGQKIEYAANVVVETADAQ